jgi:hypothetical protein
MDHVRYIDKPCEYYARDGYTSPYRWAHFDDIPFTPLGKRLAECRVGLVTTSEMAIHGEPPPIPDDDAVRGPYALLSDVSADRLYSRKAAYDRYATTLDDVDSYLPADPAQGARGRAAQQGRGPALLARLLAVQPAEDADRGRADHPAANVGGPRRCRRADRRLTGVAPDRESGRPAPRVERHPDGRVRLRPRHRRAVRRAALRLLFQAAHGGTLSSSTRSGS